MGRSRRLEGRISTRLSAAEGRKFGFTLAGAFLVFTGITWWRDHPTLMIVFGALAGAFGVGGAVVPTLLGPVQRAWMGMAHMISKVTTPIFMGVVFYLVLAPIGLAMRMLGRNPMRHKPMNGSFWFPRSSEGRGTMSNQF